MNLFFKMTQPAVTLNMYSQDKTYNFTTTAVHLKQIHVLVKLVKMGCFWPAL